MSWLVQGKRHGWGLVTCPCIVGNLDKILAGKKNKSFWTKTTSFFVLCSSFFFHCWESCLSNNSLIKCYVIHSYCQFFMILRSKEFFRNYLLKHHLPIWWGSNTVRLSGGNLPTPSVLNLMATCKQQFALLDCSWLWAGKNL